MEGSVASTFPYQTKWKPYHIWCTKALFNTKFKNNTKLEKNNTKLKKNNTKLEKNNTELKK